MTAALRLRARLLAVVSLAACGGQTSTTDSQSAQSQGPGGASGTGGSSSVGGASSTGGAPSAGGTSSSGGSGGFGAGPTAACHAGVACAVDEWCGYATGAPTPMPCGGCPTPSEYCECQSGKLVCGSSNGPTQTAFTVCYKGAEPCLPGDATAVNKLRTERWAPSCPGLGMVTSGPTIQVTSDGTMECCYEVTAGICLGRPLTVGEALRSARLSRRADWAVVPTSRT